MRALYWWIDRWRSSSAYVEMTMEEQGMYRNLLDEAWLRNGSLPNNAATLAKASGDPMRWPQVSDHILQWFKLVDGRWRNATLDRVLAESHRRAQKQAAYRQRLERKQQAWK